ncbi:MAG TPA: ATP-dependent DNA helicase PcrA [Armatimonadetes bacterium]|nr:ATP-dependent DNA helicase PcrA [Armatimonadota bacterium]
MIGLSLLDDLNDRQREAAETIDGPVLIFAGAGSGKTRALTYRIAHMVREKGIAPEHILAVTFTNKAANEMKERITRLIGDDARRLWAGTFHSICSRLLRRYGEEIGIAPNFVIYDEADQTALIKQAVSIADIDSQAYTPTRIRWAISSGKNELLDPQDYARARKGPFDEIVARVYSRYQQALRENNALDFDDLLVKAVELLRSRPKVLAALQERLRYVLVDEYQDINYAQYELVKLLSARERNICVVGDDDQSIYGWRGANVGLILSFQADNPNTRVIKLEQNYRSTQKILDCAHAVIRVNEDRAEKRLWTENGAGDNLVVYEAVNEEEEAAYVAGVVARQVRNSGTRYADYAVLYRANAMSRNLESAMREKGIPYEVVGGMSFYDRGEIKDLAAYLKLIYNLDDSISLRRIINKPARNIGEGTVSRLTQLAHSEGVTLFEACRLAGEESDLRKAQKEAVLHFYSMIRRLHEDAAAMSVSGIVKAVLERSGYTDALQASGKADDADRVDTLGELVTDAVKYEQSADEPSLGGFLERLALLSDLDKAEDLGSSVSLMTVHASKGLEFPIVFIVGMEEGIFPHERSMGDQFELAEERRLFYVALTRAQRMVYMSHARGRTIYGSPHGMIPSRFLKDLPPESIDCKFDADSPLMPRMFGDEEAAVRERTVLAGGIDITDVLRRARENSAAAAAQRQEPQTPPAQPSGGETVPEPTEAGKRKPAGATRKKAARSPAKQKKAASVQPLGTGTKVVHEDFGEGIVVSVDEKGDEPAVTVAFVAKGIKKILANHPKLKVRR